MGTLTTSDRIEIHELIARYANTIDDRDWLRFRTVFTEDCRYELTGFGRLDTVIAGVDALTAFMEASDAHPVAHHVTNVEVDDSAGDVRVFSKVIGTFANGTVGSGDYRDLVVRESGAWRIAERVVALRRPPRPEGQGFRSANR